MNISNFDSILYVSRYRELNKSNIVSEPGFGFMLLVCVLSNSLLAALSIIHMHNSIVSAVNISLNSIKYRIRKHVNVETILLFAYLTEFQLIAVSVPEFSSTE